MLDRNNRFEIKIMVVVPVEGLKYVDRGFSRTGTSQKLRTCQEAKIPHE